MPANRSADESTSDALTSKSGLRVTDESIVLKNYDSATARTVTVRLRSTDGEIIFNRSYDIAPDNVVSTQTRLQRDIYAVEAVLVTNTRKASNAASSDTEHILIGSGPDETALVEIGNGIINVSRRNL